MADIVTLTTGPMTMASGTFSNLWAARNFLNYNLIDLEIIAVGWLGASGSGTATITPMTGFQNETQSDWIANPFFFGQTAVVSQGAPAVAFRLDGWQQKYLGWSVQLAAATTVTLWVRGVARYQDE
jgi:hypothetical protein